MASGRASAGFIRTYLWNRKIGIGLICALPSLVGFLGTQVAGSILDRELGPLKARTRDAETRMTALDAETRGYERQELLRASFGIVIRANGGDGDLAFRLDQVHRASGLNSLKHIVTALAAPGFRDSIETYEKTVLGDYRKDGGSGAARLQDIETAILDAAKKRLTDDQRAVNTAQDRIEALEETKDSWQRWLTYLGWAASMVAFFVNINKPK